MKYSLLTIILSIGLCVCKIDAQLSFVDQNDWFDIDPNVGDFEGHVTMKKDKIIKDDTLAYLVYFENNQLAIEGQYFINTDKAYIKKGIWKFYYPNGKIQSERKYREKDGALIDIISLLSPSSDTLSTGYAKQNKNGTYFGHMYKYDLNGKYVSVTRYSRGFLKEEFDKDKYPDKRLQQPSIRRYQISKDEYLDELFIEEAIQLLKEDPKPLFIRVTNAWNGYSRKMNTIIEIPEIARTIKENYHLVYFELDYDGNISFEHNGEKLNFEPAGKVHKLIREFFKVNISATPTYLLVDSDLNVLAKSKGASLSQSKFMHHLRYFIDQHYQVMSYKEYGTEQ